MKKKKMAVIAAAAFAAFLWLNNTSLFASSGDAPPRFLAHRGLAQTFDMTDIQWDTNTALRMDPPEHPHLENTIASMQAAFDMGADTVELDIQLTRDQKIAVFHDFTLAYRTEAQGSVGDYTMAELKALDIGYGYSADGGATFPFRGKGVGLMPSLGEVFAAFPERQLLIHIKDYDPRIGEILWETYLAELPPDALDRIAVYGEKDPIAVLQGHAPGLRAMTKRSLLLGVALYELAGWTGYVPKAMQNTELHIPLRYAPLLWGWPHRFMERMERANTRVVLVDGDGGYSEGFDSATALGRIPEGFSGLIWTNRIDRVGAAAYPR